jgi:hypothetical protein
MEDSTMTRMPSAATAAALLFLAQPALAQEFPDKFALDVGGNYVYSSDTQFSASRSTGIIGTAIDFERDLDGNERVGTPRVTGYYRFTPHHRVDFGWVRFDREGSRTIGRELSFEDTTFFLGTNVDSEIDAQFIKLAYTYSFHHTDKVELGVTPGAIWTDYSFKLRGPRNAVSDSVSAPLPTLGFRIDYQISPRWHTKLGTDILYVDIGDKLQGSLDTSSLALEWRVARNVVLGAGLERWAVDATVDDGDFRGRLSDFYRSARLYAGVRF